MKRVYIALALLVLCCTFSLFSFFTITKESKAMLTSCSEIEKLLEQEDYEKISEQGKAIKERWKKESLPFSLLTTHYHYDAIEESVDKLYHAANSRQKEDIRKAAEDLAFEATHIITSIAPKAENIF